MIQALGFMPGSYGGRSRLGYAGGSHSYGLGAISQGEAAAALAAGISQSDIDTLDAMGATDSQLAEYVEGLVDLPTLMQQLSSTQPTQPITGATMHVEPTDWASLGIESALESLESDLSLLSQWTNSSSAVAAAIGGPLGSALDQDMAWRAQYQGWVNSAPQPGIITMPDGSQQIVSMQQAGVNPYVIVGLTAAAGLAAAILYYHHNTVAGFIAQAQAIMAQTGMAQNAAAEATALNAQADHVQATNPTAAAQYRKQAQTILNTAGTIAAGGTGATPPPAPPVDWSAWIQKNAVLIVILGGAIFLGPSLIKKI